MLNFNEQYGVVVVGIGRAGQARAAHLSHAKGCKLAGLVSRRPEFGTLELAEALRRTDVHILVIATENGSHAHLAAMALRANKHVIVEFPLCNSAAQALELYDLAQQHRRVLHVEHIGLLTRAHADLIHLHQTRPFERIVMQFQSDLSRWQAEEHAAGRWGQLAIGRLHAARDLAGPLIIQNVAIIKTPDSYQMTIELRSDTMEVVIHETRAPGLARAASASGRHVDGSEMHVTTAKTPETGLFSRDWEAFYARVDSNVASYLSDQSVIQVLELAEEISDRLCA